MFLSYERSLQPDLVGAGIIVPIAGLVGSRDLETKEGAWTGAEELKRRFPMLRVKIYGRPIDS
jgi:hypothetical protein